MTDVLRVLAEEDPLGDGLELRVIARRLTAPEPDVEAALSHAQAGSLAGRFGPTRGPEGSPITTLSEPTWVILNPGRRSLGLAPVDAFGDDVHGEPPLQ